MDKPISLSERTAHIAAAGYIERLAQLHTEMQKGVAAIAAYFRFSAELLIHSGKILCEAQETMRGDFQDWFESNAEQIGYGFSTAKMHMRVYRNYELRGSDLDKDLEDFKSQQEFLLALGISERPETGGSGGSGGKSSQPMFRLVIAAEPEKWSRVDRLEFLARFEEMKRLAERIREIEEAA